MTTERVPKMGFRPNYRFLNTAIAAVLVVAAAVLVGLYVTSYRHRIESGAAMTSVFVASKDIPDGTAGAVIGGYVKTELVPRRVIVQGAIANPSELANVVANGSILAGEQISVRQFRPAVQQGVLAEISGTQRAIVIPGAANQLLAGVVQAGDHVDVVANIKYTVHYTNGAQTDANRVASRVVLRNLVVLQPPTSSSQTIGGTQTTAITLALTDSQAQKMFFAIQNGDWTLALRPAARPADSPDSVETLDSILSDGLKSTQLLELTGGAGKGTINGQ